MQQCVGQQCLLMEEQLMIQQQQMEEDQRWLQQEERLLVTHTVHTLENAQTYKEANKQRFAETFLQDTFAAASNKMLNQVHPQISLNNTE